MPVVCLDARHAKAALALQLNKSDRNDARGLAQIVRTGWYREVAVKGVDSHLVRSLLTTRAQLVRMRVDLANQIRGVLKPFGLIAGKGGGRPFAERVRRLVAGGPLQEVAGALLVAWQAIGEPIAVLGRRLVAVARQDEAVRRLMTAPGVGVLVALAYVSVVDAPERFARSSSVGAYIGLTPWRYQSGEEDYTGHISRCGDKLLRTYLYEAANQVLTRDRLLDLAHGDAMPCRMLDVAVIPLDDVDPHRAAQRLRGAADPRRPGRRRAPRRTRQPVRPRR